VRNGMPGNDPTGDVDCGELPSVAVRERCFLVKPSALSRFLSLSLLSDMMNR